MSFILFLILTFSGWFSENNNFRKINEGNIGLSPADTMGDQKTLVLLVDFLDSGTRPITKERAYDLIFNGDFQKFYQEQSYGKISFSGSAMGWYTLQRSKNNIVIADSNFEYVADGMGIISSNNIDMTPYSRVIFLVNGLTGHDHSTLGKFQPIINGKDYQISVSVIGVRSSNNYYSSDRIVLWDSFYQPITHEMGHALGLMHANRLVCDSIISGNCYIQEYKNSFDIMGEGNLRTSVHMNAFYKNLLGWFDSSSYLTIAKSGRYTLSSLELNSGIRGIQINLPGSSTPLYTLEYRRPIGFDSNLITYFPTVQDGLMINQIISGSPQTSNTLDMTPKQYFYPGTLNGNNVFNDPQNDITIGPIIGNGASYITFDVKLPVSCQNGQKIGDVDNSGQITPADSQIAYDLYLGNQKIRGNICCADVNKDGAITPADSQMIFDRYLGKITSDFGTCLVGPSSSLVLSKAPPQITSLTPSSYQITDLFTKSKYYTDRDYIVISSLPGYLSGTKAIKTANDLLSETKFIVNRNVRLYVAWDMRENILTLTSQGWTQTLDKIYVSDVGASNEGYLQLFYKDFGAGQVSVPKKRTKSNYVIFVMSR